MKNKKHKETFAPIPFRALSDGRLSARHFRVLGVIAWHDRFGRNGQGCWAGRKRLAQESNCSDTHCSDACGNLRDWGYITSTRHPMNRRTIVHRVIYTDSDGVFLDGQTANDRSQIRDVSEADRSREGPEQVPTKNFKPLEGFRNEVSNILSINSIKDSAETALRDSAKLGQSREQKRDIEGIETYLSQVEIFLSDRATVSAVKFEYSKLTEIVDDEVLPKIIRERAEKLRNAARNVA